MRSFSLPKIKPCIEAAQQKREEENKGTRKFNIHYSFHIMNDERTSISQGETVFRSQPHFEMCERTVPIKYLNSKSKDKAGKVEDLYNLILDSPKGTEKEKDDPEKMDQHDTICKNLVNHFLRLSSREDFLNRSISYIVIGHRRMQFFQRNVGHHRLPCKCFYAKMTFELLVMETDIHLLQSAQSIA